jgi:hypothetical protein
VAYESIGTAPPSQSSLKIVEIVLRQALISDQCAEHPEDVGMRHAFGLGRLDHEPPTTHLHLHWDADSKSGALKPRALQAHSCRAARDGQWICISKGLRRRSGFGTVGGPVVGVQHAF